MKPAAKVLPVSAPPKSGGPVPGEKASTRCSAHRRAFSGRGVTVGGKLKRRPNPGRPRKGFGRGAAIRRLTDAGYIRAQGRQLSVGRGKPVRRQDVPREAVPFIQENFVI